MTAQADQILEEWLVLRCQEGDPAAFERLVERWQTRLWRHTRRLLGDEEAAWDAVQETWMAIAGQIGRLLDAAAFPAWAYRIATNKCRDHIRRETRRRRSLRESLEGFDAAQLESQVRSRRARDMREALALLPEPVQALLALHYEQGFRIAEIAEILDINEGTVKSRLFAARNLLKQMLEG